MLPSFLITFVTCLSVFECTRVQILRAKNTGKFSDKFPLTGTLGTLSTRSVSECQATCVSNKECLSFFYNAIENKCTLHGDSFTYSVPAGTGSGWKFYLTFDVTGRCPSKNGFLYQRELDLCFNLNTPVKIDFTTIKQLCQNYGGELIRIETEKRQKFIEMITANENTERICIQGTDCKTVPGTWTFDDGTYMTYFNWDDNEPNNGKCYLEMKNYKWHDLFAINANPCLPICERRF